MMIRYGQENNSAELCEPVEKISKMENAKLFKDYMENNGTKLSNYKQILELNQDVEGSLSILLERDKQFLLSTKVNYNQLHEFNIIGANGFVDSKGIYIPHSVEADNHFFGGYLPSVPYKRHWYEYPNLTRDCIQYDVVVSNGISAYDRIDFIADLGIDIFLGDILDKNDVDYKRKRKILLGYLKTIKNSHSKIKMNIDSDSKNGKEYILISRTK